MRQHSAPPLPAAIVTRLRDDLAFRVLTMDGNGWIDPYSGEVVPAPAGYEAAARAHLGRTRSWKGASPKPLRELLYLRWFHYLRGNLEFIPALRVFRNGHWLNPYDGRWVPAPDPVALTNPVRVAEHLALALCQCPAAESGRMLERAVLDALAARGPGGGQAPAPLIDPTPSRPVAVLPPARARPVRTGAEPTPARPVAVLPTAMARRPPTDPTPARPATVARGRRSDHLELKQALIAMLRRPPRLPGHQLVVHFAPHAPMPRDFYDLEELPDGRLLVVLGHVTGSGPGTSLLAGAALSAVRSVAPRHRELPALVAALNDAVRCDLVHGSAIGICAALLDPASNRLVCLAAGHPPVALLSARRDEALRHLRSTGASLGSLVGADFLASLEPVEVTLAAGDVAFFPGHGLAHAADPADPDAGRWAILAAAVAAIKRPCAELVDQVMARAKAGREQHREDLMALAVRVKDESWLLETRG